MTKDFFGYEKYLMGRNFHIHSVWFSKIWAYLMYCLVSKDVHIRSGIMHFMFQAVFENVWVKWSLYLWRSPNVTFIYQNMVNMIYWTLQVTHECSIWIWKNRPDSNRIFQVYFKSAVIECVGTLRYRRCTPICIWARILGFVSNILSWR